jgi:two-component system invasion response regulator UvrY
VHVRKAVHQSLHRRRPCHRARRLKQILADTPDIIVAGEAENGSDAIKLFRKSGCQVVLLDISMPDRSGIEVLKQIKKEKPELPC